MERRSWKGSPPVPFLHGVSLVAPRTGAVVFIIRYNSLIGRLGAERLGEAFKSVTNPIERTIARKEAEMLD